TCSASEVAAMLQGLLHHDTDAPIESNITDSHGASIIGFAFCELLDFRLMPRFKQIARMRLSGPGLPSAKPWTSIAPVISGRPIDWELIAHNYDELVKYATALKLGTAEAQQLLRRFVRGGPRRPAHRALDELGRVTQTIFLCKYLADEAVRHEVHEGRQVIEHWNSGIDFIFYGKNSELTGDDREDQEISMLAMHLLQSSLVLVNTLIIQQILSEPQWAGRLTDRDKKSAHRPDLGAHQPLRHLPHRHEHPPRPRTTQSRRASRLKPGRPPTRISRRYLAAPDTDPSTGPSCTDCGAMEPPRSRSPAMRLAGTP
ncbi:MAG TPA: Tn3 family transposase, partial [Solirubrobacteraceae bacterium]|nr:Tn3 family transposase [Solirubrobacteraceae bacterium]